MKIFISSSHGLITADENGAVLENENCNNTKPVRASEPFCKDCINNIARIDVREFARPGKDRQQYAQVY